MKWKVTQEYLFVGDMIVFANVENWKQANVFKERSFFFLFSRGVFKIPFP